MAAYLDRAEPIERGREPSGNARQGDDPEHVERR